LFFSGFSAENAPVLAGPERPDESHLVGVGFVEDGVVDDEDAVGSLDVGLDFHRIDDLAIVVAISVTAQPGKAGIFLNFCNLAKPEHRAHRLKYVMSFPFPFVWCSQWSRT
jgi:hypothetical protein